VKKFRPSPDEADTTEKARHVSAEISRLAARLCHQHPKDDHKLVVRFLNFSMGITLDQKSLEIAFQGRPDLQAAIQNAAGKTHHSLEAFPPLAPDSVFTPFVFSN